MVRDAVRNYLGLASGLTALTRQRALAAARALASGGEATAEQVQGLAEDLLATSRANREAITSLVRVEVERALGRLGLATADEVRALGARLAEAEKALRTASGPAAARSRPAKKVTDARATPAKKAAAVKRAGTKAQRASGPGSPR